LRSKSATPLSEQEQLAKRALDMSGACFALWVAVALMLLTALAIKLDVPGRFLIPATA